MNITRTIKCGAKSVSDKTSLNKTVRKRTNHATANIKKSFEQIPNFTERFSPDSNFHKLSNTTKNV